MKFKVSQQEFSKALLVNSRSLSVKTTLPVLANFLISAAKNQVEILSTNLETATKTATACKVERDGAITIPGRVILEFVSQLPDEQIIVEKTGEGLVVSTPKNTVRLTTIPAEEFPAIPKIEKGQEVKAVVEDFVKCVNRVVFSAAQDEGRPILTGVLCEINKNKLTMVATDGYRLSFQEMAVKRPSVWGNMKFVVPAKALGEVAKIAAEMGLVGVGEPAGGGSEVRMLIANDLNQVNFKIAGVEFTSRLIEGEFPNWQRIIPAAFKVQATIAKTEFIKLVKIASIFARDSGNIIRLKFGEPSAGGKTGTLTITAEAGQLGSSNSELGIEIKGGGGEIAFNFRYLLEVLAVIEGEKVNFEMIESLNPGRLTDGASQRFFHIIMPVRLQA